MKAYKVTAHYFDGDEWLIGRWELEEDAVYAADQTALEGNAEIMQCVIVTLGPDIVYKTIRIGEGR